MLNGLEAYGVALAEAAADHAREQVAQALRDALPGVAVEIAGAEIVLVGRLSADDPRLRWIASLPR